MWCAILFLAYFPEREKGIVLQSLEHYMLPSPPQCLTSVHTEKLKCRLNFRSADDKENYFLHLSSLFLY